MLAPWKKSYDKPRQHIKKQRYHFADKGLYSQSYNFPSSHVWTIKNVACRRIDPVLLEETLESPFDSKKIESVNPIRNQFWIFIGRSNVEAEAPIVWPPDAKSQLTGKDSDVGKGQEEKAVTEEEMVGWHHPLNGHEFEKIQGDSEGQGSLVCCSPWGHKESDTT